MRRTDAILALLLVAVLGFLAGLGAGALVRAHASDGQAYIILNDDHTWVYAGAVVPTPPDATATARLTPPAPLTNTPRPEATPTREVTVIPTVPTSEPPDAALCMAGVVASTLNVRAEPMISGAKVGQLAQSTRVAVTVLHVVHAEGATNREEWARIPTGWIALWYAGAELARLDDSAPCWELPKTYAEGALPVAALLWHVVPGANRAEMAATYDILRAKGIPFGVKAVNEPDACREAVAAGGICIYRSVHPGDCPDVNNPDASQEAFLYMTALRPYLQQDTHATYYEISNECSWDNPAWWNTFMLEAVRLGQLWGWPPLVLPTWNPGRPELAWLDAIRPALVALRDAGGMVGMHAYSIQPAAPLCAVNPWLSMRHRTVRAHLDALGLSDLPIVITEAARGAGDMPPDVGDFVCWVDAVRDDVGLYGAALWTAGYTAAWSQANLNGHMLAIARGVGG